MAQKELARLVAEQLAVDCGTAEVEQVLAGAGQADRRALAVLRLAGDAGEAAGLLLLGNAAGPAGERLHELTTTRVDVWEDGLRIEFEWRTRAYTVLFDVLTGHLVARPAHRGVVLAIEGIYVRKPDASGAELAMAAGRRAAEVAVRAWLGQLRSALEHPAAVRSP